MVNLKELRGMPHISANSRPTQSSTPPSKGPDLATRWRSPEQDRSWKKAKVGTRKISEVTVTGGATTIQGGKCGEISRGITQGGGVGKSLCGK